MKTQWQASWNAKCSAQLTCEARLADTLVVIRQLDAIETAGGIARIWETFVYIPLTPFSCESRGTIAAVSTHSVHAGAIIQTFKKSSRDPRGRSTIIFINFTKNTWKVIKQLNFTLLIRKQWSQFHCCLLNFAYPVCLEGRSRCNVQPDQCNSPHSGTDVTGTHLSLSHSSAQCILAYTKMT